MILIDTEMPENCAECPCLRHDSLEDVHAYQCNVTLETRIDLDIRPKWCPLVEAVPEERRVRDGHVSYKTETVYRRAI